MTPITWLLYLVALWTIAVDTGTQADTVVTVPPLVMAVYTERGISGRFILTDITEAKVGNLKLPSGEMPKFIVLLCGDNVEDSKISENQGHFIVKQVTHEINSINNELKCKYHLQTYTVTIAPRYQNYYSIGITFVVTEDVLFRVMESLYEQLESKDSKSFDVTAYLQRILHIINSQQTAGIEPVLLLAKFMKKFSITSEHKYRSVYFFHIERYNFSRMIPVLTSHTVYAHMHSNESAKDCEEIDTYISRQVVEEKKSHKDLDKKFKFNLVPSGFQWRQLIPIQDFKNPHQGKATCIYLNYILLHDTAFESLKTVESFTREVVDVINEVEILSGTYIIERESDSNGKSDENVIPSIIWKKIKYYTYAVLVVIHNQENVERICEKQDGWGWPERNNEGEIENSKHNDNEENENPEHKNEETVKIGTMYYCLVDSKICDTLNIKEDNEKPFNLNEAPFDSEWGKGVFKIMNTKN